MWPNDTPITCPKRRLCTSCSFDYVVLDLFVDFLRDIVARQFQKYLVENCTRPPSSYRCSPVNIESQSYVNFGGDACGFFVGRSSERQESREHR